MQIILLEKIANVGNLGDVVKVKDGYARNFLIPHGKAKRATPANLKAIEARRAELEGPPVKSSPRRRHLLRSSKAPRCGLPRRPALTAGYSAR